MYWFSRVGVHASYAGGLLGPMLVTALGMGLLFVPLSLAALSRVRDRDSGLASSLLNAGQVVGGAIGLAALGTVAWTAVAGSASRRRLRPPATCRPPPRPRRSCTTRPSRSASPAACGPKAAIALAAFAVAVIFIRVRREDLAGAAAVVSGQPGGAEPAREQARV
jgi:hypothetical protein